MGKIQGFDPLFFLLCCQQRKKLLTKNGIRNILCLSNSLTIKIKRIQQMYKGEKKMLEKITEIIAEQLDVDAASINAGTSLRMILRQIHLIFSSLSWQLRKSME